MAKLNIGVGSKEVKGGPVTVLNIDGIIDGSTVGQLEEQFEQLKQGGQARFLFDCAELEYISSAGIGFFMKEADASRDRQGAFVLMNLSPRVSRIFELLDLLEFFQITQNEEDALTKLSA